MNEEDERIEDADVVNEGIDLSGLSSQERDILFSSPEGSASRPAMEDVDLNFPQLIQHVIGYRSWQIPHDGGQLYNWDPGVNKAGCRGMVHQMPGHHPPEAHCGCGLYAYHSMRNNNGTYGPVTAAIKAWGKMQIASLGFRAEYAEVIAFMYIPGIEPLAEMYDVPVCADLDALEEYAETVGLPVPDEMRPHPISPHKDPNPGIYDLSSVKKPKKEISPKTLQKVQTPVEIRKTQAERHAELARIAHKKEMQARMIHWSVPDGNQASTAPGDFAMGLFSAVCITAFCVLLALGLIGPFAIFPMCALYYIVFFR